MGWLSGLFGGGKKSEPEVTSDKSYQIYDPLQGQKNAVATPLSSFLSSSVGKGVGEYQTDPNYTNRYNEFLSVNPSQYFDQNIADPATNQYKRDFLPLIQEGFAGNLRGSGRYNAQTEGINTFSEGLASQKANFVPQFAQAQLQQGQTEFARQYQNWYQSLPETNPVLSQAINFLNSGKQNTEYTDTQFAQSAPGFLEQLSGQLLSKSLNSYGSPTGTYNTQTGEPNKTSFGDATYKNPQFWMAIAQAFAASCWVASELYGGWFEPRTICARVYVNLIAPKWFRDFYYKQGKSIAGFIRKFPLMKSLLRPIFNTFSQLGLNFLIGGKLNGRT